MLEKAKREQSRLAASFEVDHVFNFFVTVNHIADYVKITGAASEATLDVFRSDQDIKDCRDLCDVAKHLRLTHRPDPATHRWSGAIGCAPMGVLPLGVDGRWELWSGDREVDIEDLVSRTLLKWEDFFVTNGI